jgi:hypothetical protein
MMDAAQARHMPEALLAMAVFVNHGLHADNYSSHCSMIEIVQSKDGNPSLGTVLKVINALGHGA